MQAGAPLFHHTFSITLQLGQVGLAVQMKNQWGDSTSLDIPKTDILQRTPYSANSHTTLAVLERVNELLQLINKVR